MSRSAWPGSGTTSGGRARSARTRPGSWYCVRCAPRASGCPAPRPIPVPRPGCSSSSRGCPKSPGCTTTVRDRPASRLTAGVVERAFAAAPPRVLHLTGITPALSPTAHSAARHALQLAKDHGSLVCLDVNFRARLWTAEQAAGILREWIPYVDVLIASDDELPLCLPEGAGGAGSPGEAGPPDEAGSPGGSHGIDEAQGVEKAQGVEGAHGAEGAQGAERAPKEPPTAPPPPLRRRPSSCWTWGSARSWSNSARTGRRPSPTAAPCTSPPRRYGPWMPWALGDAFVAGYLSALLDDEELGRMPGARRHHRSVRGRVPRRLGRRADPFGAGHAGRAARHRRPLRSATANLCPCPVTNTGAAPAAPPSS